MFSPLHRLGPSIRCNFELSSGDSHNSARTAIRSRLCAPNTFPPLPIFTLFRENVFFYSARALLLSAHAWRLRISLKTRSARACAVQTRFRPSICGVFVEPCFVKMYWFAALRPCFTAPKPCLAVFCKKHDPLTLVQSKHAFAPSIGCFFPRKCVLFTAPALFF